MARESGARRPGRAAAVAIPLVVLLFATATIGVVWLSSAVRRPLPAPAVALALPALSSGPKATVTFPAQGEAAIEAPGYGLLGSSGGDPSSTQVPIASITKVITVLAALQQLPLGAGEQGPTHTITAADAAFAAQATKVDLFHLPTPVGTVLSERQLIEASLIASSATHVMILANWAYGSLDAAAAADNEWLAAQGLAHTHVVEPTGIDPGDVSTPDDLLKLGELAMASPAVAEIVGESDVAVPGAGQVTANNPILGLDGVDGIKTGNTTQAGYCLLFTAPFTVGDHTITLIGVVLGLTDFKAVAVAAQAMLESAEAGFHQVTVAAAGTPFGSYRTSWGDDVQAVLRDPATAVLWGDEQVTPTVDLEPAGAIASGEALGTVTFTSSAGTQSVGLVADGATTDPGFRWRLANAMR